MKTLSCWVSAALLAASVAAPHAWAGITMGNDTWNTPGDLEGWTATEPGGATLSNPGGYLRISFPEQAVPLPGEDADTIHSDPVLTTGFSGDYSTFASWNMSFRFMAEDYAADRLMLEFSANSRVWSLNLTPAPVGAWTDYSVSANYSAGWTAGPGVTEADFMNDLAAVDWVGLYIGRNYDCGCGLGPAQDFGLDDFRESIMTPEPGTWMLLGASGLGFLLTWRQRRRLPA